MCKKPEDNVKCDACEKIVPKEDSVFIVGAGKTTIKCDSCSHAIVRCDWCGSDTAKESLEEVITVEPTGEEELCRCCKDCIRDFELAEQDPERIKEDIEVGTVRSKKQNENLYSR